LLFFISDYLNSTKIIIRILNKNISHFSRRGLTILIGSFGASAVIIFGAPRSPLAQPRNLIGGHVISAICGCTIRIAIDRFEHSIACALAVATAIFAMQITETTHPPGGATALIAVTTQPILPGANFLYILMPVLTGSLTLLLVALIINNMAPKRTYPSFWW
jgi:CBS-domain-containing membrane protein